LALAVDPANSKTLYAAIVNEEATALHISFDRGRSWQRSADLPDGGVKIYVNPHSPPQDRTLYVVGSRSVTRREGGRWTQGKTPVGVQRLVEVSLGFPAQGGSPMAYAISRGSIYVSDDGGMTWAWCNDGLAHFDVWSARGGKLQGRDVVLVGSLPAHVYISENKGKSWRELTAFRNTPSVDKWFFPPPPRIGHVKDIVLDGDRLLVGVEIGTLSVSMDFGETFTELPVDPDPQERDIHRVLVHPERPDRLIVANGIVGLVTSNDRGKTWRRNKMPDKANYPDAIVLSPDNPDLVFMTAGTGWPSNWYVAGRGRGKILRSRDGGATWTRLLGGLPDGQRAVFSALTIEMSSAGAALYAADTDGQVFESLNEGETWTVIADVPPVSKGEFYRALIR
jgi:photosystem II stability/assembly factor-like uncharacterized protein